MYPVPEPCKHANMAQGERLGHRLHVSADTAEFIHHGRNHCQKHKQAAPDMKKQQHIFSLAPTLTVIDKLVQSTVIIFLPTPCRDL